MFRKCSLKNKVFLFLPLLGLILISSFFYFGENKINSFTKIAEANYIPTSVIITVCGDGVLNVGEICDDGSNNGQYAYSAEDKFCNADCDGWAFYCGDGQVQSDYGEECDDGNNNSGDGCSASCKEEDSGSGGGGGGGGGVFIPPTVSTKVILKGKAYPGSDVNILKDGELSSITTADSEANFTAEITNLTSGIYTFSIWALDKKGRKSITFSFTTNVAKDMTTTVNGIFLPPTIELSKKVLQRGEVFNILGQTVPESDISIFVNSPEIIKETQADISGVWLYSFDTNLLEEGSHTTRAKATSPEGLPSTFSQTLAFSVGEGAVESIRKGDINRDGKVDLIDFSILLYNWGAPKNLSADLNNDGEVGLIDFSIMLYWWTG